MKSRLLICILSLFLFFAFASPGLTAVNMVKGTVTHVGFKKNEGYTIRVVTSAGVGFKRIISSTLAVDQKKSILATALTAQANAATVEAFLDTNDPSAGGAWVGFLIAPATN